MEGFLFMLYDKKGREIEVGDILKVFHFVSYLRKEKWFMYKQVMEIVPNPRNPERTFFKVSHLNQTNEYYMLLRDGRHMDDVEIVQGVGKQNFRDRPKHRNPENG